MRRVVYFIHVSLDGFVSDSKGEIAWAKANEEMFDIAGMQTDRSDTAVYGRNTYNIMENYWPEAGEKPGASKHDIQHSEWYNKVEKIVISSTLNEADLNNVRIISKNLPEEIVKLKNRVGGDIVLFGSPSTAHTLMEKDLIDDYWFFINPVLLGGGIPLFKNIRNKMSLELVSGKVFDSGVVCVHYKRLTDK